MTASYIVYRLQLHCENRESLTDQKWPMKLLGMKFHCLGSTVYTKQRLCPPLLVSSWSLELDHLSGSLEFGCHPQHAL